MPSYVKFVDSVAYEASIEMHTDLADAVGTYVFDVREVNEVIDVIRVTRVTIDVFTTFDPDFVVDSQADSLKAEVKSLSRSGVLEIEFNDKIFVPAIQV